MTIEDFNEEEFQIIASSDQLFEDIPLTRVVINDLEFGFECNECNRFSTRTASEKERIESIDHQPWCKFADRDSEMANIPIEGPLSEEELGGLLSKRFFSEPLEGAHKTTSEDDDGGHVSITCQEPDCPVPTNGIHDDHQKSEGSLYRKFHHLGPDAYRQVIDKSRRMMWQKINRERVNQGQQPFGS